MSVAPDSVARSGFNSIRQGGLNWDSFPLRLFVKGNAKFWDPSDLDFSADAEDWAKLGEFEQAGALALCTAFLAGEEAVTEDIQPFIRAMAAEGRFADELYLTQFCFEEAKHTLAFRRWLDALGVTADLHEWIEENPGYRVMFYEELPAVLRSLDADPSPANQVRAAVTYNHVIEGSLALTGYYSWNRICTENRIFPGMQQLIKRIGDDERRHMAWGTFTCRRHVAADDANWKVVHDTIETLTPHVVALVEYVRPGYPEAPFGIPPELTVRYATDRLARRLNAIESARGVPVERIDVDASPEQLEETFGQEDAEELAALAG